MSRERALEAVLGADDVMSVLARETRARLLNVSASGCLLECGEYLEPGTMGTLKVVVGGGAYDEAVRVTRALQVRGAGVWQVGVEFLWTSQPGSWSLRRMVSRLRREIAQQEVAVALSPPEPTRRVPREEFDLRREQAGSRRIRAPDGVHRLVCILGMQQLGTAINATTGR